MSYNPVSKSSITPVQAFELTCTIRGEEYIILIRNGVVKHMQWRGKEVPSRNWYSHPDALMEVSEWMHQLNKLKGIK